MKKNLFQATLQVVSKLNSLWDNASLSSPASKAAPTAEARLGRGSRSLFLPGIFVIPGFTVLSHVPTMLVSWVWQTCSRRGGEGPSGGWSDGLCLQSTACCYSPQFQVLPLSCGNPRWLPQLSKASLVTFSTLIAPSWQM